MVINKGPVYTDELYIHWKGKNYFSRAFAKELWYIMTTYSTPDSTIHATLMPFSRYTSGMASLTGTIPLPTDRVTPIMAAMPPQLSMAYRMCYDLLVPVKNCPCSRLTSYSDVRLSTLKNYAADLQQKQGDDYHSDGFQRIDHKSTPLITFAIDIPDIIANVCLLLLYPITLEMTRFACYASFIDYYGDKDLWSKNVQLYMSNIAVQRINKEDRSRLLMEMRDHAYIVMRQLSQYISEDDLATIVVDMLKYQAFFNKADEATLIKYQETAQVPSPTFGLASVLSCLPSKSVINKVISQLRSDPEAAGARMIMHALFSGESSWRKNIESVIAAKPNAVPAGLVPWWYQPGMVTPALEITLNSRQRAFDFDAYQLTENQETADHLVDAEELQELLTRKKGGVCVYASDKYISGNRTA